MSEAIEDGICCQYWVVPDKHNRACQAQLHSRHSLRYCGSIAERCTLIVLDVIKCLYANLASLCWPIALLPPEACCDKVTAL